VNANCEADISDVGTSFHHALCSNQRVLNILIIHDEKNGSLGGFNMIFLLDASTLIVPVLSLSQISGQYRNFGFSGGSASSLRGPRFSGHMSRSKLAKIGVMQTLSLSLDLLHD
jgi:hypothetical protein